MSFFESSSAYELLVRLLHDCDGVEEIAEPIVFLALAGCLLELEGRTARGELSTLALSCAMFDSTGETRGDFGDVGVPSSFPCLAPMTSPQALAARKTSMQNPTHLFTLHDHPTRIPQMLAVRDPRVDECPVDGRQARLAQVGERRGVVPTSLARRRAP